MFGRRALGLALHWLCKHDSALKLPNELSAAPEAGLLQKGRVGIVDSAPHLAQETREAAKEPFAGFPNLRSEGDWWLALIFPQIT